ncbi:MAG TPA: dTDP-4-dehydrorhamnose reductase [Verrucomicrobiae bacterium]|nr:dTDP-4-dehydrorhamnose reductase [Verrucomicrobiae bacterium]
MPHTILVTGGGGLLACALREFATVDCTLVFLSHADFDLTAPAQMREQLDEIRPQVVINTAAYNLVERCETEREFSWAVNATGPETLAKLCGERAVKLVHFSTDYVFDGAKNAVYAETDTPNPLNHYGAGKLAGEQAVLAASPINLGLRTSWVFGSHPTQTKSYIHSVLRAAQTGNDLQATTDQISAPTFTGDLAGWTMELIQRDAHGLFHAVNDEGVSRFDWTQIILTEARHSGLIQNLPRVEPVATGFFKSTMRRPGFSVLGNEKLAAFLRRPAGSWREGLRKMLAHESRLLVS